MALSGTYGLTPELQTSLLDAAKSGGPLGLISDQCGCRLTSLKNWLSQRDEDSPLGEFAREFERRRASKHAELFASQVRHAEEDPRTGQWLLTHLRPKEFTNHHAGRVGEAFGVRGDGQEMDAAQMERKLENLLSYPTKQMQRIMRRAFGRCNATTTAILKEALDAKMVTAEATGEPVEVQELGPVEPRPKPPRELIVSPEWIAERQAKVLQAGEQYDRIVVYGGPCTGKTRLFSACLTTHTVIHTDDFKDEGGWDAAPEAIVDAISKAGPRWVVEGVRGLAAVKLGAAAQCIINCTEPVVKRTKNQETMAKGRRTNLAKFLADRPDIVVIELG